MPADDSPTNRQGQPGLAAAALSGLCPRCSRRTLFDAPASIAFDCTACGLDFTPYERGARLAGLVTLLVAAMLIVLALALDAALGFPLWLQAAFWLPVTAAAILGTLRFYKTALLYARYEAEQEGRGS